MPSIPRGRVRPGFAVPATALLAVVLAACGTGAPSVPASPSAVATAAPTPTPLPIVPFSGEVPAGTYRWISFEPKLTLVIPAGWQIGHRHGDYFDLGLLVAPSGGSTPGVGFGRFAAAYGPTGPTPLKDAASVLDAFAANAAVKVTDRAPATLLGRSGLSARLSVSAPSTPIFDNEAGAFKLDPGWVVQCWFLDVDGGVLFVGVFGHAGDEAADLAAAQPLIEGVQVAS